MSSKDNLHKEKEIIKECKEDITAFSKLYERYIDEVYRYVYVVVNDKEKCEDITSKTFLIALEKIKDFKWKGIPIKYWFFKIARNLIYESFHKREEESLDEGRIVEEASNELIDDAVIREELKEKLNELIFKLSPRLREVIILRVWEELKYKEIAQILSIKEITAKVRFSRGVKKLREMLQREKDKRFLSINITAIILGIKFMKDMAQILPKKIFKRNLASQIDKKIKLLIKPSKMAKSKEIESLKKSPKEKLLGINVDRTIALKVFVASLGMLTIVGAVVGVSYMLARDQDEEEIVEEGTQDEPSDENIQTGDQEDEGQQTADSSQDSDEQWETYTNEEYGFSFNYPSSWELEVLGGEPYEDGENILGYSGFGVKLTKDDLKWALGYNGSWDDVAIYPTNHKEEFKIDGVDVVRVAYMEVEEGVFIGPVPKGTDVIDFMKIEDKDTFADNKWEGGGFMLENKRFTIQYSVGSDATYDEVSSDVEEMDEISKTLTTDKNDDTYSGWKEYMNAAFGFRMMIPETWYVQTEDADEITFEYEREIDTVRPLTVYEVSTFDAQSWCSIKTSVGEDMGKSYEVKSTANEYVCYIDDQPRYIIKLFETQSKQIAFEGGYFEDQELWNKLSSSIQQY